MDALAWAWFLQTAQIDIGRAIPHLIDLPVGFRREVLQIVREDGWEFAELLAADLGEPVIGLDHQPQAAAPWPALAWSVAGPRGLPFIPQDVAMRYGDIERRHERLFQAAGIARTEPGQLDYGRVRDVDMEETIVINLAKEPFDTIGTWGLAPCIAVAARARSRAGEPMLGLRHAISTEGASALDTLEAELILQGAVPESIEYFVAGGQMSTNPEDAEDEEDLLAGAARFNIVAARIHLLIPNPLPPLDDAHRAQEDPAAHSVVMTTEGIFYGLGRIYPPPQGAGGDLAG